MKPVRIADQHLARRRPSALANVAGMASTMIGSGLYDASEVGLIVGLMPDKVVRWTTDSAHGKAPVAPTFDRLFSFADLVALTVVAQIRENVSDRHLRHGVGELRKRFGFANPLAVDSVLAELATSGDSFLLRDVGDEFDDIGRGGQGTFREVVELDLKRIDFDDDGGPARWRPIDGVVIDPNIQAGAPCIGGTRIPTAVIASRLTVDEPDDIAFDLDIELAAIEVAAQFERLLADGAGIPA